MILKIALCTNADIDNNMLQDTLMHYNPCGHAISIRHFNSMKEEAFDFIIYVLDNLERYITPSIANFQEKHRASGRHTGCRMCGAAACVVYVSARDHRRGLYAVHHEF
jgi:hypothetical protein